MTLEPVPAPPPDVDGPPGGSTAAGSVAAGLAVERVAEPAAPEGFDLEAALAAAAASDLSAPAEPLPLPASARRDGPALNGLIDRMVEVYPPKVARKRRRQLRVNDPESPPEIAANTRTVPGIITQRGCCYAGCKGVVLGPIPDIVHIVHGPIGCSYYSWMTRRNQVRPGPGVANYLPYCFSTDMTEDEIIFGGEKKLAEAIREAHELLHPRAIAVFSTCPVGLIGDDVHAVARKMRKELGINVFGFSCEGYKGVSQSAGHHIANNGLFQHVVGTEEPDLPAVTTPFRINVLGEYNIGGDAFEIERVLTRCGIEVVATFSGNTNYTEIATSHTANLNVVMCHRSINYLAEMMETSYGIPWIKVNFLGAGSMAKSLRKIARYFGDADLTARVEVVIADELSQISAEKDEIRARCEGKTAMLYVGGSRAHHYQELFRDLGMPTISAGYEFAHRDDYEGREVLGDIRIDADSRNIEEIEVHPDPLNYRRRRSGAELAELAEGGLRTKDYDGMMREMPAESLIVDDISHRELEVLIEELRPDVVCSGIKDRYVIEKMGVPSKQLHNYDYGGPYAGFRGAITFYREIDRLVNAEVWRFVKPPWDGEPLASALDTTA
ncbi:MAG: nitrogenase molybdenum-iron protein alpha chain [Actinomycetota bacterium]|nr:nitrogenase molybdenum-iron protein alpha chain [Actinomycetota bacterium]